MVSVVNVPAALKQSANPAQINVAEAKRIGENGVENGPRILSTLRAAGALSRARCSGSKAPARKQMCPCYIC